MTMATTSRLFVAALCTTMACGTSPGNGTQTSTIGMACTADKDCGGSGFMCMTDHPGGYCIKTCDIAKVDADCPSGSICQYDGTSGECHKECTVTTDCRTGYTCAPASTDATNKASHAFCDMSG